MDKRYKTILPAVKNRGSKEPVGQGADGHGPLFKRKRVQAKVACDGCRLKKSACDVLRPACSACLQRGTTCTFGGHAVDIPTSSSSQTPALLVKDRHKAASEIISILQSVAGDTALEALRQIRSRDHPANLLANLRRLGGRDTPEIQEDGDLLFMSPPDQGSVEFELMIRHPVPYPALLPLDISLQSASAPRHWRMVPVDDLQEAQTPESGLPDGANGQSEADGLGSGQTSDAVTRSGSPADEFLTDPRLENVNFSDWTDVSISNEEAAHAISRYLEIDHPVLGIFDADLFLQDLEKGATQYCSGFLINSLLSWACLRSTASQSRPNNRADFYRTSLRHWEYDNVQDSLAALSAVQFLSLTATFLGRGARGAQLLGESIAMGRRMGLLGDCTYPLSEANVSNMDMDGASQAAWGLFCHASMHALQCQLGDLGSVSPPRLPLPRSYPDHTEDGLRSRSAFRGKLTFPHACRLWIIIQEVICRYYINRDIQAQDRFSIYFVQWILQRLLEWADSLPPALARGNKSTHHGIMLHIYYHASIMVLLRPLVLRRENASLVIGLTSNSSAKPIYTASINQMKQLVSMCQSGFNPRSSTIFWHTACLYVANAVIRTSESDPTRRLYFNRAIEAYATMYPAFPVTLAIIKGLLAMAISSALITNLEGYKVVRQLQQRAISQSTMPEPTHTCFMVDLDLATTDRGGAHGDSLAQKFDEMVMLDLYTNSQQDYLGDVKIG